MIKFFIVIILFNFTILYSNNYLPITFKLKSWTAIIYPECLKIYGQKNNDQNIILMGESQKHEFNNPIKINHSKDFIEISYENIKVTISQKDNRLHLYFKSKLPNNIIWPISGTDKNIQAIICPDGEGLYIPVKDKFWVSKFDNHSINNLSMPFYGYQTNNETIGYILHSDLRNKLRFIVNSDKLSNMLIHSFSRLEKKYEYEISITFTGNSPLGPAWNYKNYLISQNQYKNLLEKAKENPNIIKLFGAFHIYVWGDGRTLEFLNFMDKLGIDKLWIGYETELDLFKNNTFNVNNEFINKAKELNYLIGPYDEFHTMMDPNIADCPNVIFENMYPNAAIVDKNGNKKVGFGRRGYYISSEALALQNNKIIYDRIEKFLKTNINSYFLDCDATGKLFDDYSQEHSMTQSKDRKNRLSRMKYISQNKQLVLGSESSVYWAVPILAFSHGNFSGNNMMHWPLINNTIFYGDWDNRNRPSIFFKNIEASDEYTISKYDPCYRLPLFQAVFHEAIITTDRWEISHMKFNNIIELKELLELFYGIPSIWALDLQDAKKYAFKLKKLFTFFSPLHKAIVTKPITSFKWLTNDHKIQQIVFDDALQLTANFSDKKFQDIPAFALEIFWLQSNKKEIYIP